MLEFCLKEFLKGRGYQGRPSELVGLGFSVYQATRLLNLKKEEISVAHLSKICLRFHCTPNDLFNFVPGKHDQVPADHPARGLKKDLHTDDPSELLRRMKPEDAQEAFEYLKNKVKKKN